MSSFAEELMAALTPSQMALAFPDYYRRQLPDISNFILANRYLDSGGKFHQTGGGQQGAAYPYYDGPSGVDPNASPGRNKLSAEEMKEKLLKKGIDVDGIYKQIGASPILEGDERVDFLKGATDSELASMGLQRVQDENGKSLIQMLPVEAYKLTDEEVLKRMAGKVAPGTGELEGTQKVQKQVYDSFISAGFTDSQAKALTAEVGRENGFKENIIFGSHIDANNGKVNVGTFSWQGDRRPALLNYLKQQGALDEYGNIIPGQKTLDAMAQFTKSEMENNPAYDRTKKQFLENPNVTQEQAAEVLGNNYIRWDMTGQYGLRNPAEHAKRRDDYYAQIEEINESFPGLILENATPDQIESARQQIIQNMDKTELDNFTRKIYEQPSVTSSDYIPDRVIEEQAGFRKLPIKPELRNALEYAAEQSGLKLKVFSGGQDEHIHDAMEASGNPSSWRHSVDIEGIPGAADVFLQYTDESGKLVTLSATNPEHAPIIAEFTRNFSRVTPSAGVGANYMKTGGQVDPTKFHYGGPNAPDAPAATWGNMPAYLQEAHAAGVAQRASDLESGIDPLKEWIAKKEQEKKLAEAQQTTVPETTPQKALGGNVYGLNEDLTLVETNTGNPVAQVNENEKLIKQGSMMQVTPETKIVAEQLSDNTSVNTTDAEEPQTSPEPTKLNKQVELPPQRETDNMWRESINATAYDPSPSYQRAMNKAKYQNTERESRSWSRAKVS
jgi:hypothetical protein